MRGDVVPHKLIGNYGAKFLTKGKMAEIHGKQSPYLTISLKNIIIG